jgi:hypothetical protein
MRLSAGFSESAFIKADGFCKETGGFLFFTF